jgi:hypothetical protein
LKKLVKLDKVKLENKKAMELEDDAYSNPFIIGSTVKKVNDDQAWRLNMSNNNGTFVDVPGADVMDTKAILGTMTIGKNYPSEGWRSFGGKYDFNVDYNGLVK